MEYWTLDIPYHSHRSYRASKFVAAMGYGWQLCSHSFPGQQIASAFLPIHFPYVKMWQNWAPYQFHIFTQPSHTIPRYGSYVAHVLPYHSHTFSLVRVSLNIFFWLLGWFISLLIIEVIMHQIPGCASFLCCINSMHRSMCKDNFIFAQHRT